MDRRAFIGNALSAIAAVGSAVAGLCGRKPEPWTTSDDIGPSTTFITRCEPPFQYSTTMKSGECDVRGSCGYEVDWFRFPRQPEDPWFAEIREAERQHWDEQWRRTQDEIRAVIARHNN